MKGLACSVRYRPLHPAHPLNCLPPHNPFVRTIVPLSPPPHMQPAPFPQHPSTYHTAPLPPPSSILPPNPPSFSPILASSIPPPFLISHSSLIFSSSHLLTFLPSYLPPFPPPQDHPPFHLNFFLHPHLNSSARLAALVG